MMIRRIAVLGDDNKNYENNDSDNDIKYNDDEILYEFASPIFFDFFFPPFLAGVWVRRKNVKNLPPRIRLPDELNLKRPLSAVLNTRKKCVISALFLCDGST